MKRILLIMLLVLSWWTADAQKPVNGEPLAAGGRDGLSALAFGKHITSDPLGYAFLDGSREASLFIFTPSGNEIRLWRCDIDGNAVDGHPVYRKVNEIQTPWGKKIGNAKIFQVGKDVYMVRSSRTKLTILQWDGIDSFVEYATRNISGLPSNVVDFDIIRRDKRTLEMAALVSDGQIYRPDSLKYNRLSLYDGAGSYRGAFPKCGLYRILLDEDFNQVGNTERISRGMDIVISPSSVACIGDCGYVVSNNLGAMKFLPYHRKIAKGGEPVSHLRQADGSVWTFRCHGAKTVAIPAADGSRTRLLIGGESALYVHDLLKTDGDSVPRYSASTMVLEKNAPLYGGSLTVPNIVDWDGDGVLDIVAGNSEARLLFFKNRGTDAVPDFCMPVEVCAAGEPICLRPGYYVTQGPLEGAWGYLAPTVFDWNGDGLPDVVTSGSKAKYEVFLNVGTKSEPLLAAPFTLMCDAMDLHGTWRVRPAITLIDGVVHIVTMDDGNALHLYRKVDDRNVEDVGHLLLKDGSTITGHNGDKGEALGLGQWGRGKLRFFDWDGDGDQDLFVGCIKRASFPRPGTGLPYRRFKQKKNGLQVLYFENMGDMIFAEPLQMQVDGEDISLGAHSNAPEPCLLGDTTHGANMVVGCESGKYFFYGREHITFTE